MCTFSLFLIVFFLFLCVYLGWKTTLLRDTVNPTLFQAAALKAGITQENLGDISPPFSLARVQLAVWTVIISSSFLYIVFCLSSDANCPPCLKIPINETALILMGISVATTLTGNVIDKSQMDRPRHQDHPSRGFFIDILSDENGMSIHRFQNILWTSVAITIYLNKVACTNCGQCRLPDLDMTLIVLTGISSASYLGLKINENEKPIPAKPSNIERANDPILP